jgi:hypothetical protein
MEMLRCVVAQWRLESSLVAVLLEVRHWTVECVEVGRPDFLP